MSHTRLSGFLAEVGAIAVSVLIAAAVPASATSVEAPRAISTHAAPASWKTVASYRDSVTDLNGVSCPSTSICEAVGENNSEGAAIRTMNGGASWATDKLPSGIAYLSGIACPSTSVCQAVGESVGSTVGLAI